MGTLGLFFSLTAGEVKVNVGDNVSSSAVNHVGSINLVADAETSFWIPKWRLRTSGLWGPGVSSF